MERSPGIGPVTTRCLLTEVTELREDIQAQSMIIAQMDLALRSMFSELRRANIARYRPAAED